MGRGCNAALHPGPKVATAPESQRGGQAGPRGSRVATVVVGQRSRMYVFQLLVCSEKFVWNQLTTQFGQFLVVLVAVGWCHNNYSITSTPSHQLRKTVLGRDPSHLLLVHGWLVENM